VTANVLSSVISAGQRQHPALNLPDVQRIVSYGDLDGAVATLARKLSALGLPRGHRVALVAPDGRQFVKQLFARAAATVQS
jgi:non-ribosomal peptide synthetase component E (peptide arylation enzyme)